jgi:parallel beta-helix repeat protein
LKVSQRILTETLLLTSDKVSIKGCATLKKTSTFGLFKITTYITITLLVMVNIGSFTSANFIPTEPISSLYIRSDGRVDPSTPQISINGNVYTFTAPFTNTTIIVERDGITIDGAGYSMTGHSLNYGNAIDISNRTNITIKNLVVNQFGIAVVMQHTQNNILIENKLSTFTAFMLASADNNYIVNNTSTQGYGIYGTGSNNQIMNNSFIGSLSSGGGNGMGMLLTGSHNIVSNNTVVHGVCMELYCQDSIISYNTVLNGRAGLFLLRASNNLVYGNIIRNITTDSPTITAQAFYISDGSTNNSIFGNTFEKNAVAVSLGAQVVTSIWNNVSNNYFYENDFLSNVENVWVAPGSPINYWDNGQQGNFWSDFQGVDSNHDGISEIPYIINANNTDNHPLMTPYINQNAIDIHSSSTPSPSQTLTPSPQTTLTPTSTQPNIEPSTQPSLSPNVTSLPTNTKTDNIPENQVPEFPIMKVLIIILIVAPVLMIAIARKIRHQQVN